MFLVLLLLLRRRRSGGRVRHIRDGGLSQLVGAFQTLDHLAQFFYVLVVRVFGLIVGPKGTEEVGKCVHKSKSISICVLEEVSAHRGP